MRVLILREGLASQILNYVFGRYMEEMSGGGVKIYHDLSYYGVSKSHNGFELDTVFPNIKLNLLCHAFDKGSGYYGNRNVGFMTYRDTCMREFDMKKMFHVKTSTNVALDRTGHSYVILNQGATVRQNGKFVGDYFEHILFHGWFFSILFFQAVEEKIRYELQFPDILDELNKNYLEQIKSTISVGVHVRRGDFLKHNWELQAVDYAPGINKLKNKFREQGKKPVFFIFTNDFPWFKENIKEHGFDLEDEIVLVEGNDVDAKNYIDMQLMSNCSYLVSNQRSAFSRVAAWLNPNLVKHIEIRKK